MRAELPRLDAAAARIGDRWTLLVVAALLDGPRRFGELQEGLPGLAPNVLSKRLKVLEAEGLLVSSPYSQRPLRVAYQLTDAGSSLAGALRLLSQWGADHPRRRRPSAPAAGAADPADATATDDDVLRHDTCGSAVEARWWCPTCARLVDDGEASELRWV